MLILDARLTAEKRLRQAGLDSAKAEALQILEFVTELERTELLLSKDELTEAQLKKLLSILKRRKKREPLQHILGYSYFYGLKLEVSPNALIPRPETERLVELALEKLLPIREPTVLDVATGSGAVALALKQERPDAIVWASDISPNALRLAKENAARHELAVTFFEADLLRTKPASIEFGKLDLLVANLPYLPLSDKEILSPELAYDPDLALYAGKDGLDLYKRLEPAAFKHLKKGAVCLLELDPRNVGQALATASEWRAKRIYKDLNELERFLLLKR